MNSLLNSYLKTVSTTRTTPLKASHKRKRSLPRSKMPKRAAAETYDSDGGFVEDAPKSKKTKSKSDFKMASAATVGAPVEMQKDSEGGVFWEISGKRRLQVTNFRGKSFVGIREFYEKDGQMLPGKKGISMTVEQYNAIVELLPQVEKVLKKQGHEAVRPEYSGGIGGKKEKVEESDEEEAEEAEAKESGAEEEQDEEEVVTKKTKTKLDKFKHSGKKNHEATSDEDGG